MEKQNNYDYGYTDPDFIDQNTLVDGTYSNEDQYKQDLMKENNWEFGESDPDVIEQNMLIDNDNYARDEDPYQYQEEFIEDLKHHEQDFEKKPNVNSENIPNQERIINEDDAVTNDDDENDFDDNYDPEFDYEDDLDKDEELDDFDAEHYPENHPRE
ncbi:hypothetical protein SAMN05444671_0150 [Flavobacterium sp. CF108]|jgi:hypothetical protein|uniref:hypothetical protein n=1 Tax=unclassified Flavobacterium TaxID=196869 RepID=UPI0008C54872|nr:MULTISPECIES: hypothetical protein [unclassified Flavobacterium]SEO65261.1 hypothetical protein SAMN04487978_3322 [Flavobacterium sp. fv08]SHI06038.1 hypothetical protein SAMN05444671_0150 [Flavobacterium sp. CF108]